jgi:hypothetical protein
MNSLTAVLAWDYLRRYYLLLLACFLVALCSIVPYSSSVAGPYYDQFPRLRAITYSSILIKPILIILLGMIFTHTQIGHLYLKPISTFALVTHCYSMGAVLFATQIAVVVGLWKWYYNLDDWPIVQPVLYALICWGVIYPSIPSMSNTRGSIKALRTLHFAVGIWLCGSEVMVPPKAEAAESPFSLGLTPTVADVSLTAAVLVLGFCSMLYCANHDRSNCYIADLMKAANETPFWSQMEAIRLRSLTNSREAYQDFNWRYQTVPAFLYLFIIGLIITLSPWVFDVPNDAGSNAIDNFPTGFWFILPPLITLAVFLCFFLWIPIPESLTSIIWTPETNNALLQYRQYGFDSYFKNLPIADQDIVDGKLRSSFVPIAYAFPLVLLLGILPSTVPMDEQFDIGVNSISQPLSTSLGKAFTFAFASVGIAFVILNIQSLVTAVLMRPWRWIVPAIAFFIAYFSNFPFAYSLGVALLLLLFVIAYTFTEFTDGDRERLSKAGRLIPGTCGGSFALRSRLPSP